MHGFRALRLDMLPEERRARADCAKRSHGLSQECHRAASAAAVAIAAAASLSTARIRDELLWQCLPRATHRHGADGREQRGYSDRGAGRELLQRVRGLGGVRRLRSLWIDVLSQGWRGRAGVAGWAHRVPQGRRIAATSTTITAAAIAITAAVITITAIAIAATTFTTVSYTHLTLPTILLV